MLRGEEYFLSQFRRTEEQGKIAVSLYRHQREKGDLDGPRDFEEFECRATPRVCSVQFHRPSHSFFHPLDRRFNASVFGYVDRSKRSGTHWITGNLPQRRRADFSKSRRFFFCSLVVSAPVDFSTLADLLKTRGRSAMLAEISGVFLLSDNSNI